MSGVYLVVWDGSGTVLPCTSGGVPHVTLVYCGRDNVSRGDLLVWGKNCLEVFSEKEFVLESAHLNSFHHEKEGRVRHDVLLTLDAESSHMVEKAREILSAGHPNKSKFSMRQPHVTYSTNWSEEEASLRLSKIRELLPLRVEVVGVTIN